MSWIDTSRRTRGPGPGRCLSWGALLLWLIPAAAQADHPEEMVGV